MRRGIKTPVNFDPEACSLIISKVMRSEAVSALSLWDEVGDGERGPVLVCCFTEQGKLINDGGDVISCRSAAPSLCSWFHGLDSQAEQLFLRVSVRVHVSTYGSPKSVVTQTNS